MLWITTSISPDFELSGDAWVVVNDGVMGGRSTARVVPVGKDGLRFTGELSLENNGGFSSTRRALDAPPSGQLGVRFRSRGDGRCYQFRVRRDRSEGDIAWRGTFTAGQDWHTAELRFDALEPVHRGRSVPEAGRITAEQVAQIGFLLADGQAGPFTLEVRDFRFFGPDD